MERVKDGYLEALQKIVSLSGKRILEIGCGNGSRTVQIAEHCLEIVAIDPDVASLHQAIKERSRTNICYKQGAADDIGYPESSFDLIFFTLSLHHVPVQDMNKAIEEAIRVCRREGYIVFLEPAFDGTFFDAEIRFDACDGDERQEKAYAYASMLSHPDLIEIAEIPDETIFKFESLEDFITSMHPKKKDEKEIAAFLMQHNHLLNARRRLNIFQPKK